MNDVATTEPAYLKQYEGEHLQDNFDSTDVAIPQIRLLQGLSDQVTEFNDAVVGEFWHTGMDIPLGPVAKFVVASRRKRYLLQAPLGDGQGVLARADDGKTWDRLGKFEVQVDKKTRVEWEIADLDVEKSGLAEWGTFDPTDSNSPPAATLFYDYLVLLPDHPELGPSVISIARTSLRSAKKGLNDKILLHKNNGRPMQSIVFEARAGSETNDQGDFFVWRFRQAGFASEEAFNMAMKLGTDMQYYKVKDDIGDAT